MAWCSQIGLPKVLALLRVADRLFECRARDAQPPRGDVDALGFEPRHHVLEAFALAPADEVLRRHAEVLKQQLAGFQALVAELVYVAAHREPRLSFLCDKSAHPRVCGLCVFVSLRQYQQDFAAPPVGDPHLRAVYQIVVAAPGRGRPYGLQVSARVRLRQTDGPALIAARKHR